MFVDCLFLLDGMNRVLHLAYFLRCFVPDMCRIKLMVVNFLTLSLGLLDSVRIGRYIQLNIVLVSSIVLHVMPNFMSFLDNWSLLLFVGMMSCGVVVLCLVLRLMPHFSL